VSAAPIEDLPVASDVLVAQAVLDRLEKLADANPEQAAAVAEAILTVGEAKAVPIRIDLPNGPPGAKYMVLAPSDPDAPVIIYRPRIPAVDGGPGWLVTALLPRDEYQQYREAERTGLLDDPTFQKLMLAALALGIIWLASRPSKPPTT
jgi:hypothetical protein